MLEDRPRLRKCQTRVRNVVLGAVGVRLLQGDANRISLRFFGTATAAWTATPGSVAVSGLGWTMQIGQVSEYLDYEQHEDLVVGEWSAIAPGGALTVCVVETVLLN